MASIAAVVRVLSCCAMGLAALPAAAQIPTYPLPSALHYLGTSGPGPINPGVIVGFNPQPDPPGFADRVDLANPMDLMIAFGGAVPRTTTILFNMHGLSMGDPYSMMGVGTFMELGDHMASYMFDEMGDGAMYQVTFDISGFAGGWTSFNPQPDPPGDLGFAFTAMSTDPGLSVQIDYVLPSGGLAPLSFIPEPAGLGFLLMGAATMIGLRRKATG